MVNKCDWCDGTGKVEWTKERGGPVCNKCGGAGKLTPQHAELLIAGILDGNSVYMGGPSQQSRKRAKRIIEVLADYGVLNGD